MIIEILYEDGDLMVIGKPAGVVINRAETVKSETIQDWAEHKLNLQIAQPNESEQIFFSRAGIVHRLDKETSGALIIAKSVTAFENLQSQFKSRSIQKTYIALTHEKIIVPEGEINVPLSRSSFNRQKFGVSADGKASVTSYKVLEYYTHSRNMKHIPGMGSGEEHYTLIEAYPKTGRTHQIRVHFKHYGHPLVSDSKYTGRKRYKKDLLWCQRLFLHAARIQFTQPTTNKLILVEQSLPVDLQQVLTKLTKI